jgi:hypothetical protein
VDLPTSMLRLVKPAIAVTLSPEATPGRQASAQHQQGETLLPSRGFSVLSWQPRGSLPVSQMVTNWAILCRRSTPERNTRRTDHHRGWRHRGDLDRHPNASHSRLKALTHPS